MPVSRKDPHSASNFNAFKIQSMELDWNVNFKEKKISGSALISFKALLPYRETSVILDTKHLFIKSVFYLGEGGNQECSFSIDNSINKYSDALVIALPDQNVPEFHLKVVYETLPNSSAIQWLEPVQTAGKVHPYLFTQCQAIHARSLVPCQDSSSIKFTYKAAVQVDSHFTVLMSAVNDDEIKNDVKTLQQCETKTYHFIQSNPIPSYLLALVVGNLEGAPISQRCTIWSEPEVLNCCVKEFEDTERFLQIAEGIAGPYVWTKYDLLVLPPSFPYGGMENPCLTFVTPSLLAGDKSLVDVVAHEISHSWTGNLVTAASGEHFWLNEGFTMFLERKILAQLHGENFRHFDSLIGLNELMEDVKHFGMHNPLTCLVPDLSNHHTDDYFSRVPYEKGYNLLFTLESFIGEKKFSRYLRAHLEHFANKSIVTDDWKEFLFQYFENDQSVSEFLRTFDFKSWLYEPGFLPSIPKYNDNGISDQVKGVVSLIFNEKNQENILKLYSEFSTHQRIFFFDSLVEEESGRIPIEFFSTFRDKLESDKNVEIQFRWLTLCLKNSYEPAIKIARKFVIQHGRMKYCRKIYRLLFDSQPKETVDLFLMHKTFYHPIATSMIEKDLQLSSE